MIEIEEIYQLIKNVNNLKSLILGLNFTISTSDWTKNTSTNKYEYILMHNLNLDITDNDILIRDVNNNRINTISISFINKNNFRLISDTDIHTEIMIKASIAKINNAVSEGHTHILENITDRNKIDDKINTAVSTVVGSAPDVLNTLYELGNALNNDANFAATISTELSNKSDKTHKHDEYLTDEELLTELGKNYYKKNETIPKDIGFIENPAALSIPPCSNSEFKYMIVRKNNDYDGGEITVFYTKVPLYCYEKTEWFNGGIRLGASKTVEADGYTPHYIFTLNKNSSQWSAETYFSGGNGVMPVSLCISQNYHTHDYLSCKQKLIMCNYYIEYADFDARKRTGRVKEFPSIENMIQIPSLQNKRMSNANLSKFVGMAGELVVGTDDSKVTIHDNKTTGGIELAKKSYVDSNVDFLNSRITLNGFDKDWGTVDEITASNCSGYPAIPYHDNLDGYIIYKRIDNKIGLFQCDKRYNVWHIYRGDNTYPMFNNSKVGSFHARGYELKSDQSGWTLIADASSAPTSGYFLSPDSSIPINKVFLKSYKIDLHDGDITCIANETILITAYNSLKNKQIQLRRGADSSNKNFIGLSGEVVVNSTNNTLHVHDGVKVGGYELAKKDDLQQINSSLNSILTRLDNIERNYLTKVEFEDYKSQQLNQ